MTKCPILDVMMCDDDCQKVIDGVVVGGSIPESDCGSIPESDCGGIDNNKLDDSLIYDGHGYPIGVRDYNKSDSKEILYDGHGYPIGYRF
jgi:hypothetical protein